MDLAVLLTEALAVLPGSAALRGNATAYLLVNAAHILGIALTLGAILPLDLRLMGAFPSLPLRHIGPFLVRSAATGLALAMVTGLWLLSVNAAEYLANTAFLVKAGLLALALANVLVLHRLPGFRAALDGRPPRGAVRALAALSFVLWPGVLLAGRWIGFL